MADLCTICLCGLSDHDDEVCELVPCKHRFHTKCIQTWLVQSQTCPTCRTTTSLCNHGDVWSHPKHIIKTIIDPVIVSYKRQLSDNVLEMKEMNDMIMALRMQIDEHNYSSVLFQAVQLPNDVMEFLNAAAAGNDFS
jgi:hypothetical protein